MFLVKVGEEIFSILPGKIRNYNLSKDEWVAMRKLAEDRNIIIKAADKGSNIVVWGREDYLKEASSQLSDTSKYNMCEFSESDLLKLTEESNKIFLDLKKKSFITEK